MQVEIEQMKRQLTELEAYRVGIEGQQLTFPLDEQSKIAVSKDILIRADIDLIPYTLASYNESTTIEINGTKYLLDTSEFLQF